MNERETSFIFFIFFCFSLFPVIDFIVRKEEKSRERSKNFVNDKEEKHFVRNSKIDNITNELR